MKNCLFALFVMVIFLTGCGNSTEKNSDKGSSGKTSGYILDDLMQYKSHEELVKAFGKDVVKGIMPGPEGMEIPSSILYPDSEKLVYFTFEDKTVEDSAPTMISISGERSPWKTATGVTLGNTVADVEKANGKPFLISGFGWDYGGNVTDWDGGKMTKYQIGFSETAENISLEDKDYAKVYGDGTFVNSSEPLLANLKPVVVDIYIIAAE